MTNYVEERMVRMVIISTTRLIFTTRLMDESRNIHLNRAVQINGFGKLVKNKEVLVKLAYDILQNRRYGKRDYTFSDL